MIKQRRSMLKLHREPVNRLALKGNFSIQSWFQVLIMFSYSAETSSCYRISKFCMNCWTCHSLWHAVAVVNSLCVLSVGFMQQFLPYTRALKCIYGRCHHWESTALDFSLGSSLCVMQSYGISIFKEQMFPELDWGAMFPMGNMTESWTFLSLSSLFSS